MTGGRKITKNAREKGKRRKRSEDDFKYTGHPNVFFGMTEGNETQKHDINLRKSLVHL